MRDFNLETERRVAFIRDLVARAGVRGIVFANSGGKDAALVGILCKMACADTVGVILPCGVARNYDSDRADALLLGEMFDIVHHEIDLRGVRDTLLQGIGQAIGDEWGASNHANISIAPRLRMTAVYAIANAQNRLVAGTGNRSERHMGYFTKWGDGAFDFNPIADLTATEVFAFLRHLGAPSAIVDKAPSAGLFEGQTDETEMGVTYAALDAYLQSGEATAHDRAIIDRHHAAAAHKCTPPAIYGEAHGAAK